MGGENGDFQSKELLKHSQVQPMKSEILIFFVKFTKTGLCTHGMHFFTEGIEPLCLGTDVCGKEVGKKEF